MGKSKWIVILGALLVALCASTMAAPGADAKVFMVADATTNGSAALISYAYVGADGSNTALSVSNTLGTPEGVAGLPEGADEAGAVIIACFPRGGAPVVYNSAGNPVGSGLEADGTLAAGQTMTVMLKDVLANAGHTGDFVGYCYVIVGADAMTGTYVNMFKTAGAFQAFQMTTDLAGVGVTID